MDKLVTAMDEESTTPLSLNKSQLDKNHVIPLMFSYQPIR